jgi:hypothetical protein
MKQKELTKGAVFFFILVLRTNLLASDIPDLECCVLAPKIWQRLAYGSVLHVYGKNNATVPKRFAHLIDEIMVCLHLHISCICT